MKTITISIGKAIDLSITVGITTTGFDNIVDAIVV